MRLLITGGSGFIGTHLAARAEHACVEWVNLDIQPPVSGERSGRWVEVDIMDASALDEAVQAFEPTHILHLAARTDTKADTLADYAVNTVGTVNLLEAVRELPRLRRFVFTSSQFVVAPGVTATSDLHFAPHTAYGESKAVGELLTRAALRSDVWVTVRPTNIWGPWHPRYPKEFWHVLQRGLYVHPRRPDTQRTYGYVGNVADQMWAALTLSADQVCGRVFYLGDPPMRLREWVDEFAEALTGRRARTVPAAVLRALAAVGDVAAKLGVRAPLTTSRFRSMTEDYITPTTESVRALGTRGVSLREGVRETVAWLQR